MTGDRRPGRLNVVSLLDVEPDLGRGIDEADWQAARLATRSQLAAVGSGPWDPLAKVAPADVLAVIVADGLIGRENAFGGQVVLELFGPGDVLLGGTSEPDHADLAGSPIINALTASTLLILRPRFILAAARWPALLSNLNRRAEVSRRRLASQGLVVQLPRAEDRVLLTLWILAASCGRVTAEGITMRLPLSHELLGRMAAARRPTVTLALGRLRSAGYIRRGDDGSLLLTNAAQTRVATLTTAGQEAPPIGPHLALRTPPRTNSTPPSGDHRARPGVSPERLRVPVRAG